MVTTDLVSWCIGEREWLKIEKEGESIVSGDGCNLQWKNGDGSFLSKKKI